LNVPKLLTHYSLFSDAFTHGFIKRGKKKKRKERGVQYQVDKPIWVLFPSF